MRAPRIVPQEIQDKMHAIVDWYPALQVYSTSWVGGYLFIYMGPKPFDQQVEICLHPNNVIVLNERDKETRIL
jgi:hypothetical protein